MARKRQDTWADVCLKNVVVLLAACTGMHINPQVVYDALPEKAGRTRDALAKAWCTLTEFNQILDALVEELGHPAHLIEVGRHSNRVSFGFEYVQRLLLKGIARWFTSPSIGIHQIPTAAQSFNRNKHWRALLEPKEAKGRQLFMVSYPPGPNQEQPRSPLADSRSLLYFVRGVAEVIATLWPWQGRVGHVRYAVVQIPALDLIHKEMPEARVEFADGTLRVDNEIYGHVVFLVPDAQKGHLGEYQETAPESGEEFVAGICMVRDLCTPCKKSGKLLPLMREGEIYEHPGIPLPGTIIELKWRDILPLRVLAQIIGRWFSGSFDTSLSNESRASEAEASAADARLQQWLGQRHMARAFPTPEIARAVTGGTFEELDILTCAMFVDIVGSTKIGRKMQHSEKVGMIRELMEPLARIAQRHGGWYYKFTGDGGVFVFTNGWTRPAQGTMKQSVVAAVQAAREMQQAAADLNLQLRIGIHVDRVTWYALQEKFSFEGTGLALDNAKRMEEIAPDGRVAVSVEAIETLGTDRDFGPQVILQDKHGFSHHAHLLDE